MVDAGLCWDTATAIRRARQFEQFNLTWLEEPLHPDNVAGLRAGSSAASPMRIAAGEEICDVKEFRTMMDVGGIDVVQVDVTRVGGLARSQAHRLGLGRAASAVRQSFLQDRHQHRRQSCTSSPPCRTRTTSSIASSRARCGKRLTKQRFPVIDGDICVPEEPGLGIELDEEVVAKYRVG